MKSTILVTDWLPQTLSFSDNPWSVILQKNPSICVWSVLFQASFREASPIRTAETHLHLDGYLRESSSIGFDCWNRTTHTQKETVTIWRHVLKNVSYVCVWRIWQHNTNTQNRENAKAANAASHFSFRNDQINKTNPSKQSLNCLTVTLPPIWATYDVLMV